MVTDVISRLVDKSLVNADIVGSKSRYRLLEVVRQYAEAQLAAESWRTVAAAICSGTRRPPKHTTLTAAARSSVNRLAGLTWSRTTCARPYRLPLQHSPGSR